MKKNTYPLFSTLVIHSKKGVFYQKLYIRDQEKIFSAVHWQQPDAVCTGALKKSQK